MLGGMSTALDAEVRELLMSKRGAWKAVATRSGVSYSWISKFVNGHIPNPGYATLRDLRAHLVEVKSDETREAA